jgi:glucosamine-6-phosphate deaminase
MDLRIHPTREEMGRASAAIGAEAMARTIERDGRVVIVLASAVSQNDFLEALGSDPRIDWSKVVAFQ